MIPHMSSHFVNIAGMRMRHAQVQVMDNCGHWPQRERPDEFNRILNEFPHD